MKIKFSIMATESRRELAEKLSASLGGIPISYDNGSGIWWNRVNAMKLCGNDCDFVCVLQDDAIPCKDLINKLSFVINDNNMAYSLYFGNRKNMKELAEEGLKKGGLKLDWLSWGVAIVLPTRIISDLITFGDKLRRYDRHDDTKISKYLQKIGMKIYYPLPSLVDHDHEEKSLMQLGGGKRKAYKFIDND
jgi:hypothetical protein